MGKGGKKRDWGYASVADDGNLIYTSYEKDGSVNRYKDNGLVVIAMNIGKILSIIIVEKILMIADMKVMIHQILTQERYKIMEDVI